MAGISPAQARFFRFGPFELDVRAGELRKHGIRIKLREQPIRILVMLLDHPGEVVLREEIRLGLWPNNTMVEFDHGINAAIQKLREALGESADKPRYVETVARRGYRFLGEVERVDEAQPPPAPAPQPQPEREAPPEAPDSVDLTGKVLSHYRILGKLGEGGMGVVYRAEDQKLGRQVALKFLPPAGELSEAMVRRFEQEARAASALNHPHICTIHGLEDLAGQPAIVMELVEGETLAARLAAGPLPLQVALAVGVQIADALDAAHRRGVVHRDLKPANIMLTGGKARPGVKVLDFGLAKMVEPVMVGFGGSEAMTERGAIVGTLAYMSPEQVEGKEADPRSDIFSFGLVLYEMITGQPAFRASSRATMIAAILEREPPVFAPEGLNPVVRACVAKDPDERFQSARDLKLALEWSISGGAAPAPRPSRRWVPWVAAAAAVALAFVIGLRVAPVATPATRLALTILPPAGSALIPVGSLSSAPEISPDGSSVLYATDEGLWVRRLDSLEPKYLRGSQGRSSAPFWSADSKSVIYPTLPDLIRIRLPDDVPEAIAKFPGGLRGGTQSDNGTILIGFGGRLFAVPASGGEAKRVDVPGIKAGPCEYPQFLAGGDDFLFLLVPKDEEGAEVYLATLRDGKVVNPILLMKNDTAARYTPAGGGRVLFVRNDNLYSQKLDRSSRKLTGDAEILQQGVASGPGSLVRRADFSVSRPGAVAWRAGRAALNQVTIFDRQGKQIDTAGPPGKILGVFLSPDETRLLAEGPDGAWLLTPGQPGSLSLGKGPPIHWSPDGMLLSQDSGRLMERSANGSTEVHEIGHAVGGLEDISPDGQRVLIQRKGDFYISPLEGTAKVHAPEVVVHTGEFMYSASFSPDGQWIVYSAGMNVQDVYAQPLTGSRLRTQIGSARGMSNPVAVWRKDGKEIVFADGRGVWSVRVDRAGGGLRFGAPELLFSGVRWPAGYGTNTQPLAVSRDGSRIYWPQAVVQPPDSGVIHILTGWAGK